MTNRHTATFDGQTFTRNSKTRVYTNVVIGRNPLDKELAEAVAYLPRLKEMAAERPECKHRKGLVERYENEIARLEARKAAGHKFDEWGAWGWNGRPDLAQKEFDRLSNSPNLRGIEFKILEATLVTK
jgi:hypothetical protein